MHFIKIIYIYLAKNHVDFKKKNENLFFKMFFIVFYSSMLFI